MRTLTKDEAEILLQEQAVELGANAPEDETFVAIEKWAKSENAALGFECLSALANHSKTTGMPCSTAKEFWKLMADTLESLICTHVKIKTDE